MALAQRTPSPALERYDAPSPNFVPGVQIEGKARKQGNPGMNASNSDRTISVYFDGSDDSMALGAKVSTSVLEVRQMIAGFVQDSPDSIVLKRRTNTGLRVLNRDADEAPNIVVVSGRDGARSLRPKQKEYEHPIVVLGAGLGGIQNLMEMIDRGRTDLVCIDKHADFGGHSWIEVANRFTKLQTERGTYHVDYMYKSAPVPRAFGDMNYTTWPSRDNILRMMRENARDNGLYKYAMFNQNVEKVMPNKSKRGSGYTIQYQPWKLFEEVDEDEPGEMLLASALCAWPGFLHETNLLEFPGEDDFGGYIEYASFDKVDYKQVEGKTVVLYGHGAFGIENVRTFCEHRCAKVYVVCRTRNLCGTKMTSWMVGSLENPMPGNVLLDSFQKMYSLVGFNCWKAHSVQTDAKKSFAHITQKTIFGVTDIYFLAGYYGLMECVVSEIKRLSHRCVHTKKYQKLECDVLVKAIGTKPSFKTDKQLGIKEVVGTWINGDPLLFVSLGNKGVAAQNYGSFSVGPAFIPQIKISSHFFDYPQDWALVKDKLMRNKAGEWPAFVVGASYPLPMMMALGASIPEIGKQMAAADALKAAKQGESHPMHEYLAEVKGEWEAYIRYFKKHNMVDDRPEPPYPYTVATMEELFGKVRRVSQKQPVHFEEPDFVNE